jgi:hypothetical protein
MATNPTFNEQELTAIHLALIKARSVLFDAVEIKFDKRATPQMRRHAAWRGERGTCPTLQDIDKAIAISRVHIDADEAMRMYDAMGMFDHPKKEDPS